MKKLVIPLFMALSGCQYLHHDTHTVYCKQLKSNIVFNAATGNVRQAEIQRGQAPLENMNYDDHCSAR